MIKRSSQTLSIWFIFWDLLSIAAAWGGAYYLRFASGWFAYDREIPDPELCWDSLPLVLILALVAFRIVGQYEVQRLRRFREEFLAVCKGTALLTLLVMAGIFSVRDPYASRGAIILFAPMALVLVLTARRITWNGVGYLRRRGYNQSFAIIVGTGRVARQTARRCVMRPGWASRISVSWKTVPRAGRAISIFSEPLMICPGLSKNIKSSTSLSRCR